MDDFINVINQHPVEGFAPQAEVRLAEVPWDNGYRNIRLFGSKAQLHNYIEQVQTLYVQGLSYCKISKGYVDLPYNEVEPIEKSNYIEIYNLPVEARRHYGFITSVEWLSVHSCRVHYELDVWQENFDQMGFKDGFIHYSHVPKSSDVPGAYTYPEGLEVGQYVNRVLDSSDMHVISYPREGSYPVPPGGFTFSNGLIPPRANLADSNNSADNICYYIIYWDTAASLAEKTIRGIYFGAKVDYHYRASDINTVIGNFTTEEAQNIVSTGILPYIFMAGREEEKRFTFSIDKKQSGAFGTYTPSNAKCYCYPYNFLLLDNGTTGAVQLKYEYFTTDNCVFNVMLPADTIMEMTVIPQAYSGNPNNQQYRITFKDFPKLGVPIDSLKAYLANNSIALLGSAAAVGVSIAAGNPAGAVSGAIGIASSVQQADVSADTSYTSAGGYTSLYNGKMGVQAFNVHCNEEYIKKIDGHFSMYGYRLEEPGRINITSRSAWNYIKADDVQISGVLEPESRERIRNIFSAGVFFWHDNDIGNFNRANN